MPSIAGSVVILVGAGVLEVFGDAFIRWRLAGSSRFWALLGPGLLVAYGFFVNLPSSETVAHRIGMAAPVRFGDLLGVYVAVFFFVSQVAGWCCLNESGPQGWCQWAGAALIVFGGALFQIGSSN